MNNKNVPFLAHFLSKMAISWYRPNFEEKEILFEIRTSDEMVISVIFMFAQLTLPFYILWVSATKTDY